MDLFSFIQTFNDKHNAKYSCTAPFAKTPIRSTSGSAGYDMSVCMAADPELLHSPFASMEMNQISIFDGSTYLQKDGYIKSKSGIILMPGKTVKIHTGIKMEIPNGYCGLLMNRSSLANNSRLTLCDNVGLIDSDYRGEITLKLHNGSDSIRFIMNNERVCQMVFIKYGELNFDVAIRLSETSRGEGGYGSTGR